MSAYYLIGSLHEAGLGLSKMRRIVIAFRLTTPWSRLSSCSEDHNQVSNPQTFSGVCVRVRVCVCVHVHVCVTRCRNLKESIAGGRNYYGMRESFD